jgi:perosamine synthetase
LTPIPISRPLLGDAELAAVAQPLRDGWLVQGPRVAEFEARFAAFCGAEHAVATTSCTTALHVAVVALGAGPGDEVVVPAFTWVSTASVVEFTGATPVFCDVSLDSFNLDPSELERAITERTVGVIPVHLFGRSADMAVVNDVAQRHGLWVLEDAACALGTRQAGRHAGRLGQAGCFSFHPASRSPRARAGWSSPTMERSPRRRGRCAITAPRGRCTSATPRPDRSSWPSTTGSASTTA